MLHQELLQLVRVFLDLFLEDCHFLDEVVEILVEDVVEVAGFVVEILDSGVDTVAESRCDLALPDCSPTVFASSLIIYITSVYK